ncbi:MAG: ArnT family glycosyltransferase [Mucilaginibacter sp.]
MIGETLNSNQNKLLYVLLAVAVLVNFSGLLVPIAGPDAAIYATISKTMVQRNDYVQLFYHGADWLDKPRFPFWITALFFKVFGFTTWAYKLPGILFLMMGALYTWRLARTLYNKQIATWSVLILLTAEHIVLSNNDVRAEAYLTGLIIAAVYHFYRTCTSYTFLHLLLGCIFTSCAIMTKGIFALVPIGGAIAGHLIITRQWKALFNWRWLVATVLILIFILPELWCLYRQFDMHPEKIIFGQKGVSGIRFFFWDSQFGRFFNTGPIKGSGDPFFFLHTVLWAFLPWSLIMIAGLYRFIRKGWKNPGAQEWYCLSGALLTFILFSASGFQLPHYLNIIFPFLAIITAQCLYYVSIKKTMMTIELVQTVVIGLLLSAILLLNHFFQPEIFSLYTAATLTILLILLIFYHQTIGIYGYQKLAIRSVLASFIINLYLGLSFYPSLMKYQAGSEAAFWINNHNPRNLPVAVTELNDDDETPFAFYSRLPVTLVKGNGKNTQSGPFLLYLRKNELGGFNKRGYRFDILSTFRRYPVTRLTFSFLDKNTRTEKLTEMAVIKVK